MREELDTSPDYRGVPYKEAAKNLEVQGACLKYLVLFACAADAGSGTAYNKIVYCTDEDRPLPEAL